MIIDAERGEGLEGAGVGISLAFCLDHVYMHREGWTSLYTPLLTGIYTSQKVQCDVLKSFSNFGISDSH